jgi:uncharacterized protein with LGFP repeats
MPTTGIQTRLDGFRAKFVGGIVYSNPRTGTVPVLGTAITSAYLHAGGVVSKLGWPTRTNHPTASGERVDFEHGYIGYTAQTGVATVHVTP